MNGISEVYFAARDGLAGGVNLTNDYIAKRKIKVNEHDEMLEIVQLVIKTDYMYRNYGNRTNNILKYWEKTCPVGIHIGKVWFEEKKLDRFVKRDFKIGEVINEIAAAYQSNWQLP